MSANNEAAPEGRRELVEIPLDKIRTAADQPRQTMDEEALSELTRTVAKEGVLQPILVHPDGEGGYVVVAGNRRLAAARRAEQATIPALIVSDNFREIALIENMVRENLTVIEEAEGLELLLSEKQYNQEELAMIVGKARNTICEILSLAKLPQEIRDDCRGDRTISRRDLVEIAKKKQARSMLTAYHAYKAKLQRGTVTRKKSDPNNPQDLLDLLMKTATKIKGMDTVAWTEENKSDLHTNLTSLRTEIDNYFQNSSPPPPA